MWKCLSCKMLKGYIFYSSYFIGLIAIFKPVIWTPIKVVLFRYTLELVRK